MKAKSGSLVEKSIYPSATEIRGERSLCIVCLSDLFWDEHWSSEQQLMLRLAKRCPVLYVDRPVSILSFFTGASDASVTRQWSRWLRGGIRKESHNLTIVTPAPLLPLRYNRLVNRFNCWVRRQSIKRALRKLGFRNTVLWIYTPDAGRIVGTLGEICSLYYCADDWSASDQWWNKARDIRAREKELASRANLIIGTSTRIVEHWKSHHPSTMLMKNGGDVDAFKAARDPRLKIPSDLESIPGPRIGYVGFVDGRFDTALYAQLAKNRPGWQFIIIGPLMERHVNLTLLRKMANIHFLGTRTRGELPAYLKGFDVCTIPYICSELAQSIFPLKLFEYLAAGRPIVSTGLPELAPYEDYVHVARTFEDFEKSIERSLSEPLPGASEAFLAENSWDSKADVLWETLQEVLSSGSDSPQREGSLGSGK